MSLIEGIGDEVTLVFALLILLFVGLLAWFSTHTSDIPFFSVIVVELSQRANRNRNTGESRLENNTDSGNVLPEQNRRSISDVVSSALDNVNEALGLDRVILEDDEEEETTDNTDEDDDGREENDDTDQTERQSSTVASDPAGVSQASSLTSHTTGQQDDGEDVSNGTENQLRRRVKTFFGNSPNEVPTSSSETTESNTEEVVSDETGSNLTSTLTNTGENIQHSSVNSTEDENQIRVRLKYLNDTQRLVLARPLDTIGFFKRTHFSEELSQQKLVRLIYNGQDLRNETSTLQSCNVVDNSVLHCLVTQNLQTQQPVNYDSDDDINIGNFMVPIFGLLLGALWYMRFNYKQYFNATSTLSLTGISFLFLFAAFTALRPHNGHQDNSNLE